jgi:hypothetical protein
MDGCRHLALRDERIIRQAVVDPASGTILFHALARDDRADLGVWRLRSSDPQPERVVPPLEAGDPFLAEVGPIWTTRLVLSSDGEDLAVQSCGAAACRTRIVHLSSGGVRRLAGPEEGELIGLDGAHTVGFRACGGLPCPLVVTDIASGEQRVISAAAMSASTWHRGGRFLALATESVAGGQRLTAIDVGTARQWELARPAATVALLPESGGSGAGIELPDGDLPGLDVGTNAPLALEIDPLAKEPKEAAR